MSVPLNKSRTAQPGEKADKKRFPGGLLGEGKILGRDNRAKVRL